MLTKLNVFPNIFLSQEEEGTACFKVSNIIWEKGV